MNNDEVAAALEQLDNSGLSSVLRAIDSGNVDAGVLIRVPVDRQPTKPIRMNMRTELYGRFVQLWRDGFAEDMTQVLTHCAIIGYIKTLQERGGAYDPILERIVSENNAEQMKALTDSIDNYIDQLEKYEGAPQELARTGLVRMLEQCMRKGLQKEAKRIRRALDERDS